MSEHPDIAQVKQWLRSGYKEVTSPDGIVEKVNLTKTEISLYKKVLSEMDTEAIQAQRKNEEEELERENRLSRSSNVSGVPDEEEFQRRFRGD